MLLEKLLGDWWISRYRPASVVRAFEPVSCKNRDGRTALHLAVLNGNANVAEALVKAGADVRLEDVS